MPDEGDPIQGEDAGLHLRADAGPPPLHARPDSGWGDGTGRTADACDHDSDCAGGTCLGAPGGDNGLDPGFAGGYCTSITCTIGSQEGCGPDESCVDGGKSGYCVKLCSKAEGMTCTRSDHVCLGLGTWGGCYSEQAVECNVRTNEGCDPATELCVNLGFEIDENLGRREPRCDPTHDQCGGADGCYYTRRYDAAFCAVPGTTAAEERCTCDKCCVEGFKCTPDLDGAGKHCKGYCEVSAGCPDGSQCVPLELGAPYGGCVAPGPEGTR